MHTPENQKQGFEELVKLHDFFEKHKADVPKIIQDFRKHNEADKKEYALVEAAELKLKKAQEEYAKARSKYDEIHNTDDIIETREIMRLIRRHDWLIEQINDREKVEALGIKRITPKLKGSSTKREIEEEIDSALLIIINPASK